MIIGISGKLKSGKDEVGNIIRYLTSPEYKDGWKNYLNWKEAVDNFYNGKWKNIKFADKLKDMVCLLLGCTREQLEDQTFKETPLGEEWWYYKSKKYGNIYDYTEYKDTNLSKSENYELVKTTPRLILQQIGTEGGRDLIHPNMWIIATMKHYKMQGAIDEDGNKYRYMEFPKWLITDLRFINEAQIIQKYKGITIRVERPFHNRFPEYSLLEEIKSNNQELYEKLTHFSETGLDSYNDFSYIISNDGTLQDLVEQVKAILIKENLL